MAMHNIRDRELRSTVINTRPIFERGGVAVGRMRRNGSVASSGRPSETLNI
jgi:hypothetical protein